ncbi:cAMP-binding domain of CRP or a regulatory subunit of cAMP-dependent protein kinases [Pedobacter rhizosphaerae]|uniref:cAMP-binding domain of CRP or a regulatory subunit of cAMP-dependent protein kinases n=2 Tax=Pedobacter rhizosphaerae TaxID=390241 RepID=A0A1H9SZ04_9SPHI|nr:cAMP-binding domain of CRP or a regulatory subunit of cAMP-dependent protein kinases [Pedobacter rhizosphaerae]
MTQSITMQHFNISEDDLLETLSFIMPLPTPMQNRIKEESLIETFERKKILLSPGETARRIYFIRSGFLRSYFIDEDGKECTTWFSGKGDLMTSASSFFSQQPANEYIEVLQDCKLQSLTWLELNAYYADFKEGNLLGRIIIQKYYILGEERAILLRTQRPEHKYDLLLKNHPQIEQQTTQQNIASYLGISRETLSRIRRKKLEMCHLTQKQQKDKQ